MAFFFFGKRHRGADGEANRGLLLEDSRSILDEEQTLLSYDEDVGVRRFPRYLRKRAKGGRQEIVGRSPHDPPFRQDWGDATTKRSGSQVIGSHHAVTPPPQFVRAPSGTIVTTVLGVKTDSSSTSSTCTAMTPTSSPTRPDKKTFALEQPVEYPDCISLSLLLDDDDDNALLYQRSDIQQRMVATSCRRHLLRTGAQYEGQEVALHVVPEERIASAIAADNLLEAIQEAMKHPSSHSLRCLLVILYLAHGQPAKALQHNISHINDMAEIEAPTTAEGAMAVFLLLEHGLVQLGCGELEEAMAAWREAIHMSMGLHGYSTPVVAMLLSYLGIGHFCCGNIKSSTQLMEESLELQRLLLSGGDASVDDALFRLANTMGNLSVISFSREDDEECALSLLDEALTLYDSISLNVDEVSSLIRQKIEARAQNKHRKVPRSVEGACKIIDDVLLRVTSSQSGVTLNTLRTADMRLYEQLRLSMVFGSGDGLRRLTPNLIDPSALVCQDMLMMGPLGPRRLTNCERAQETVLSWFDARATTSCENRRDSILVDADDVNLNANLNLPQIHLQTLKHLEREEIQEAVELLESTLRSLRSKCGENHHLVGSALQNLGMVYLFSEEYTTALRRFDEAFQICSRILGPNHPDVYESLSKGALVHFATGDLWKAHDAFWAIYDRMKASGYPVMYKILNSIAITTYELGDIVNALEIFQGSLEAQVYVTKQKLNGKESLRQLEEGRANLLENLAFISFDCGIDKHALNYYNAAKEILKGEGGDLLRLRCIEDNIEHIRRNMKPQQAKKPRMDNLLLETVMSTWCQAII